MLLRLGPWCLPLGTAWVLFCTLRAAAWERIQSLRVVESYGFAVYEQIIRNQALEGSFFQTIHRGYIDHWMWSGHRSVALYPVAELYALAPEPLTLATIQVACVALGTFPAYALGRTVLGGVSGGMVGVLLYAGFPPIWAMALQDYQDLVLGIPFALTAVWAAQARRGGAFVVAGLLTACTREEWAMTLPLLGLTFAGGWRVRLRGLALGVGCTLTFGALAWWLGRDAHGYETPAQTHGLAMLLHPPPIQRTWADYGRFYAYFLYPANYVAALGPLVAAPGLAALALHLTTPQGSGIDADWRGHIHHMAPVATFLVAGGIVGFGRAFALLFPPPGQGRLRAALAGRGATPRWALLLLLLGLGGAFWGHDGAWLRFWSLTPTADPRLAESPRLRPEWALVAALPADAVVGVDQAGALFVSGFRRSFTYDESLPDKSRRGLAELDYALVSREDPDVLREALALGGAVQAETPAYQLVRLPGASRLGDTAR